MSKKLTRKLVALAMAAAMVSGTGFIAATDNPVFPTLTVSAASTATDAKDFTIYSTTTIQCYNGSDTSIVIPVSYTNSNNTKVDFTTLGRSSIYQVLSANSNVTTISFEKGSKITTINNSAFKNAASLKKITLPDGLTKISDYAFQGCTNLETIEIPASVTYIGQGAFAGCTSLKTVVIKGTDESTLSIGNSAFAGCTALKSINLTDRIAALGSYAFSDCTALTSVNIPSNIRRINGSNTGEIDNGMFYGCSSLTSVTINEGITQIYNYAFQNCTGLTEIRLPETVKSVWQDTFKGCTNLKRMVINNKSTNVPSSVPSSTIIYAPEGTANGGRTSYPLLKNTSSVGNTNVEVGSKVTINKKAEGGKGTYKYAVYARKSGTSAWTTVQNWTTSTIPCYYTIPQKGTYEICVKAADMVNPTVAENLIEKQFFTVNGVIANTPLTLTAKLSSDVTVKKQPLTLTMSADGGSNTGYTYTVQYKKETDEKWSTVVRDTAQTTVKVTPQSAAEYTVRVIAKDSTNNVQTTKYLTFTSYAQLKNLSTVSVSGKTVTVSKKSAGGNGKLTYQVWYQKENDIDAAGNWHKTGAKFTLAEVGTYSVCVKVIDESKTVAKRYFSVTVK